MNFSKMSNNYLGFTNTAELLPKGFDTFKSREKLRQMFLNLSTIVFKPIFSFTKYEQYKLSKYPLQTAFDYKIKQLLPISYTKPYVFHKKFVLCAKSTKIINNYIHKTPFDKISNISNNLIPVAKFISMCYKNNTMQLLIDKHLLFHEFVLNKIKKLHINKQVLDLGDSITLISENKAILKIYTSWENIQVKKPNIVNELEQAVQCIKKGEVSQVYLVYPKDDIFKKQIPIYVDELKNFEYQIKVIPYSLRSILRNTKE